MRVIIAGGGTGGHVFPGLALAEELKKRDAVVEVVFVGTEAGIEARVVPREGYPIRYVRASGIVGMSVFGKMRAVMLSVLSIFDAYRIIQAVRPDIVIGVGGYASGAVVFLASLLSVPTMILEQNSAPGMTNKILGKFVDSVCVTYQESMSFFPSDKAFLTGNPVRERLLKGSAAVGRRLFSLGEGLFTVFVFGGSSGARSINKAIVECLPHLDDLKDRVQFLHQTGQADYDAVRNAFRESGYRGTIVPFIYEMGDAYAAADLVISRAGATTLAELTVLGKPAILVPYPFAAGRHQEFNALKLQEMGAARVILDGELRGETLAAAIRELVLDAATREEMRRASASIGRPDAAARVADVAFSLLRQSSPSGARHAV